MTYANTQRGKYAKRIDTVLKKYPRGSAIIYFNKHGEQCPGEVRDINSTGTRVWIRVTLPDMPFNKSYVDRWVSPTNLKLQDNT